MTCIAGIVHNGVVHNGVVHIGGDSAGVGGRYNLVVRSERKVFKNGDFVLGGTTSFRMLNLLAYKLSPPKPRIGQDIFSFMVCDFIDSVRDCLKSGGYAQKEKEQEVGGSFLVGYAGRIFVVHGDYQVGESSHGFDAVGCGDQIALGSLHSTRLCTDPVARLREALEAAEHFSGGVRGPFHFVSTEDEKVVA